MTKQEIINKVMSPIVNNGFTAYFVGGCVRDEIMHIEPHDYDICTDATPEQLHKIFNNFIGDNSEKYGVTKPIINGEAIDIATFRSDMTRGRHPTVVFTKNIDEDAHRRDFTCNALYESIDGQIIDPTGLGLSDIKNHVLRFVGNMTDRVMEDPLRLFRFCRFEAAKGLDSSSSLSTDEFKGMLAKVDALGGFQELYKEVSKERMLSELQGIFGGKFFMTECDKTFSHMEMLGITDAVGLKPILDSMEKTAQNPKWHSEGNVLIHTVMTMKEMAKQPHDWIDMLAALLHDIGKPACAERKEKKHPEDTFYKMKDHPETGAPLAYRFCKSIGMSNHDSETIQNLVLHHMDMHRFTEWSSRFKKKTLLHNDDFERLVKLCRADERGCVPVEPDEWPKIDEALAMPEVKELLESPMPKPWVTGEDLIKAGCKPGQKFKKALDVAYKMQIDGHETRKSAILSTVIALAK